MKLAEALVQRADLKKRLTELQARLTQNVRVQEGETPLEPPDVMLRELSDDLTAYRTLIQRINRTNAATRLADGRTITDYIAERDVLIIEQRALDTIIDAATETKWRYTRTEIKQVVTVDVAALRQQLDAVSKRLREVDMAIQKANWEIELGE